MYASVIVVQVSCIQHQPQTTYTSLHALAEVERPSISIREIPSYRKKKLRNLKNVSVLDQLMNRRGSELTERRVMN